MSAALTHVAHTAYAAREFLFGGAIAAGIAAILLTRPFYDGGLR